MGLFVPAGGTEGTNRPIKGSLVTATFEGRSHNVIAFS